MELRAVGTELDGRVLERLRVDDVGERAVGGDCNPRTLLRLRRLPGVDDRVLPPRAHHERSELRARRPVAVGHEVVGVDDVGLHAVGEPRERSRHAEAA